MNTLSEIIMGQARLLPEGGILLSKDFWHLANRVTINRVFHTLNEDEKLLRIARGAYVVPIPGRHGVRPPPSEKVVRALVKHSDEIVVPHGASSANALGLTQKIPDHETFLTSGRTRELTLGDSVVLLKHAPRWMLELGERPAGAAIRALAWIGPAQVTRAVAQLHRFLPSAEWKAMMVARASLPNWMARAIGEEARSA